MGLGGISIWQLLIVLLIVVLIFGTKKLKNMGSDLGGAVRNFKDSMTEGKEDADKEAEEEIDQLENKVSEAVDKGPADKGSADKGSADKGSADKGSVDKGSAGKASSDKASVEKTRDDSGSSS